MYLAEIPMLDEQIDHPRSGRAGGINRIGCRFDYDPGFGLLSRVSRTRFDKGPVQRSLVMYEKAKRDVRRTLDAVDAHFAIALGRMGIASGKSAPGFSTGK